MLSDEAKEQIRLEEVMRHEIRSQLREHNDKSISARMWTFVNSAFFLWFLSTIVVGIIGYEYTKWEKQKDNERRIYDERQASARDRLISQRKLDAEIASRLSYFAILYDSKPDASAYLVLQKPSAAEYPINVFPEYANRSLQSLLWELQDIVPENEKIQVKQAFDVTKQFSQFYTASTPPQSSMSRKAITFRQEVPKDELKKLDLERWGNPLRDLLRQSEG